MKLKVLLPVLALGLFMSSSAFGITVRYVQLIERNSDNSWNMVELEAFLDGVTPNDAGGSSGDGLTTSTNDIGDGVIGVLASQTTATLQHGGGNTDPNNTLDSGSGAWTTNGDGGFGDPQYTLDLGGDFNVRLLRFWPRQGCCANRWGGDIEVNLFADGGGGTLGELRETHTVTPANISDAFELAIGDNPIPEPATAALLGAGLFGLLGRRKRHIA